MAKYISYTEYLQSDHWNKKKNEALSHYGGSCVLCSSKSYLNVHHRNYNNLWHELMSDLTVLCAKCHDSYHKIAKEIKLLELDALDATQFCKIIFDNEEEIELTRINWTLDMPEIQAHLAHCLFVHNQSLKVIQSTKEYYKIK